MSSIFSQLTRKGRKRAYLAGLKESLNQDWAEFRPKTRVENGVELAEVECASCPKFAAFPARCTVPFGSRLRSCITASTEYHLRSGTGLRILEIGCGESSFARSVIEDLGGTWIGLDQRAGKGAAASVRSIAARIPEIPFLDNSLDGIFGIQTIEHWEDIFTPGDLTYAQALDDIWRALKPGGWAYFDAPVHLHGAKPFIRGDLKAIRNIFETDKWCNIKLTGWRRRTAPLKPHFAPKAESDRWLEVLGQDAEQEVSDLKQKPAWILGIWAEKRQDG